ncbi:MAG TPA: transaldolase family protein [Candidatus Acidoferrum sp.]|nr:transaldolase family protein [Candidatus Acidoferrum sp.]
MDIFLDTASINEIREILPWGLISGVTTNQKIFLAEKGCDFKQRVKEILSLVNGPLSVELTKTDGTDDDMIKEALEYSRWNPKNIVIKVPMFGNGRGLEIISQLRKRRVKTNATALISVNQVMLAAKAGATYASIFFNRVKDAGENAELVVKQSRALLDGMDTPTKIIVGSIRRPEDVAQAVISGTHVITIPYKILVQMPYHKKTEETIAEFDRAWQEFKQAEKK